MSPDKRDAMLTMRMATDADAPILASLNHQLIRDEGHRNPMTEPELEARMRGFLRGRYAAVMFYRDDAVVAYVLYRTTADGGIYLRQFFVTPDARREGVGREAVALLRTLWPTGTRVTVEVLSGNEIAQSFWRSMGFADYSLTLELWN